MSYLFDYVPSVPTPPGGVAGDIQVNNGAGGFAGETLLPLANGGTDANLSLTGGTSYVLRQSSVGAAITVSQLGYSELSGLPTLAVTKAAVTSYWLSAYNATTGAFSTAQPTFSDLSAHPTTLGGYGITDAISSGVMTTLGDTLYENVKPTPTKLSGNITTTKMYLSQTGNGATSAAPVWAQINYSDIAGTNPTPPSGSVLWSALGNAGAALTLANAGYATTFNQTSAVNWTWANTTAAVNATTLPALIASATYAQTPNTMTPSSVDTTGATLLVAVIATYQSNVPTITDSKSNTWNYLTYYSSTVSYPRNTTVIAYAYSHSGGALAVGAGHTFSVSGTGNGRTAAVIYAFSNTLNTAAVYDSSNGVNTTSASTTLLTGSITPTGGDLVVTGIGDGNSESFASGTSINNSFTGLSSVYDGNATSAAGAYLLNAAGSPLNPTWTTNSDIKSAAIACFKPAAVVITPQSSPIINLDGTYWNGASSAVDTWTIQDVISAATNGASTLTFAHTGSSGVAAVQVPILNATTDIMSPLHLFPSAADAGISRLGAASLAIGNGTAGNKTGSISLKQITMATAVSAAPTSTGTAGTIGQIVRYGGVLYFCSVTGIAGSATWNSLNMTAV